MAFWMKKIANVYLTLTHPALSIESRRYLCYNIILLFIIKNRR